VVRARLASFWLRRPRQHRPRQNEATRARTTETQRHRDPIAPNPGVPAPHACAVAWSPQPRCACSNSQRFWELDKNQIGSWEVCDSGKVHGRRALSEPGTPRRRHAETQRSRDRRGTPRAGDSERPSAGRPAYRPTVRGPNRAETRPMQDGTGFVSARFGPRPPPPRSLLLRGSA